MSRAMVPDGLQCKVALEVISCEAQLCGLVVVEVGGKTVMRDMHMFSVKPSWSRNLHVWGEAGVVMEGKNSKTGDKGITMMFASYANCKGNSVRMWDLSTTQVIVTHDMIWLT